MACEQWLPASLRAAVTRAQSSADDSALAARLASLSPQQFRVLVLVAEGLLNKQIADRLDVQERTVKAHLSAIFDRLGRSEEHTSEPQSLMRISYAVFCLKKKTSASPPPTATCIHSNRQN